jgi:hypothetical protein
VAGPTTRRGVGYLRYDNSLLAIDDLEAASKLCQRFAHRAWPRVLNAFAPRVNPIFASIEAAGYGGYYCVIDEAEFATDVMFRFEAHRAQLRWALPPVSRGIRKSISKDSEPPAGTGPAAGQFRVWDSVRGTAPSKLRVNERTDTSARFGRRIGQGDPVDKRRSRCHRRRGLKPDNQLRDRRRNRRRWLAEGKLDRAAEVTPRHNVDSPTGSCGRKRSIWGRPYGHPSISRSTQDRFAD